MTRRGRFYSVCLVLVILCACDDNAPAEASRAARIERTTVLLRRVLFDDAARIEAERYVDMCDASPLDMFYEDDEALDPEGTQRFSSLHEARESGYATDGTGLDLAEAACTSAGLEEVRAFGNI